MREEILLDVIVLLVAGLLVTVVILRAISEARRGIVTRQLTIRQEIRAMSNAVDRVEAGTTKLVEDAGNVQRVVADLKTVVSDLQAQIAAGQLDQDRLNAAAAKLEQADTDLDAVAPDVPTAKF